MAMPPRKAPSVSESPAAPVAQPAASARNSAVAVNTSVVRALAMRRKSGPVAKRAKSTATPNAARALAAAIPSSVPIPASPSPPRAPAATRRAMAAMSWKIRIDCAARPTGQSCCPRARISPITTAVEDSPSVAPTTTAMGQSSPMSRASAAKPPPATSICKLPKPKMLAASARIVDKEKCSPRLKRRNMTPASASVSTMGPSKRSAWPVAASPRPSTR